MQFPCKRLYYSRFPPTPKHLQLLWLAMAVLLCMYVSRCGSSSCPSPCDLSACPRLQQRNCEYRYRDSCNCCEYCGRGPGDLCEGQYNLYGYCATGLECVVELEEGLPPQQQEQLPGRCTAPTTTPIETNAPTTAPTTATTATTAATATATVTSDLSATTSSTATTTVLSTTSSTAPKTTTQAVISPTTLVECRKECSMDFCGGEKNRVCSAKGLEFAPSSTRNSCQHTSCHACVLLVRPSVCGDIRCGEPPSKPCLRTYFDCIRNYYFVSSSTRVLTLHDSEAREIYQQGRGRILCHVPGLIS